MADIQETYDNISEAQDIRSSFDARMLTELIEGQIGKLNELDASVRSALEAAEKAENFSRKAQELSAGRGLFTDKKKAAIEGVQSAGVGLAEAVQTGAKAQKMAFEFQTRLAEITKYLFSLGVRNIAANRLVVRELEARLAGASEEEISELARQEIMAVVLQLKEQEDLLKKQDVLRQKQARMVDELKSHENKILYALQQVDDLELRLKDQEEQLQVSVSSIDNLGQEAKQQKQEVAALQQQLCEQQSLLNALSNALMLAEANAEQTTANLRSALNQRMAILVALALALSAAAYFLR